MSLGLCKRACRIATACKSKTLQAKQYGIKHPTGTASIRWFKKYLRRSSSRIFRKAGFGGFRILENPRSLSWRAIGGQSVGKCVDFPTFKCVQLVETTEVQTASSGSTETPRSCEHRLELNWLVVSTHLKNMSQKGNLPQVGVKIKNIGNHHPVNHGFRNSFKSPFLHSPDEPTFFHKEKDCSIW